MLPFDRHTVHELARQGLGLDDIAVRCRVPRLHVGHWVRVWGGWPSWWLPC